MLDLNFLSEALLLSVKKEEDYSTLVEELSNSNIADIKALNTDKQKIAFWINIYNAFYQILAKENSGIGKSIFKLKEINIAGSHFSLDDVEHGILRRGKHKYSLGYFNSLFRFSKFRTLRPKLLDFRIHFALNCGAKSCPPIAFYSPTRLDEQLNLSTSSFIVSETSIDMVLREVKISKLFSWFWKDFGGRKGVNKILKTYLNFDITNFKIKFADYDWTVNLGSFGK